MALTALPLPQKWDSNEWFVIGTHLLGLLAITRLPKRFPGCVTVLIFLFSMAVVRGVDDIIAGPPFDWYDISDVPEWELMDLLVYVLYGYVGYIYLYIYDAARSQSWFRAWHIGPYILMWGGISIGTEWLSLQARLYTYKGWNLMFSFPVYLPVLSVTILFYHLLKYNYPTLQRQEQDRGVNEDERPTAFPYTPRT